MKSYLYTVFVFTIILIVGCRKSSKIVKVFSPEGKIEEMYEINDDSLKNGIYLSFYENGDTFQIAHYTDDKLNGERRIFKKGQILEILENYKMDSLDGVHETYYTSGNIKRRMVFDNHEIADKIMVYYESGSVKETVSIMDNVENGPFVEYYENGQKAWEGTYENGENEIGLLIHFAENGDTIRKMHCDERYICRTFYKNENYSKQEEGD